MSARLRLLAAPWGRDVAFHLAGLLTAVVAVVLWNVGVAVSMSIAITYAGLIVTLWTLLALRWLARVERRRAAIVLGAPIDERYRPTPPDDARRWTARLHELMGEPAIWRDFAWAALWGYVGPVVSSLAVGLWIGVLGIVALPFWYWAVPGGADYGIQSIDTLPSALAAAVIGLVLVPCCGLAVRGITAGELVLMHWMLRAREDASMQARSTSRPPGAVERAPVMAPSFELHVAFSMLLAVVMVILWAATGMGYFWPVWVCVGLAIPLALHAVIRRMLAQPPGAERRLRLHAELSATLATLCLVIWALAGMGIFWPFWPWLSLGIVLAVHAIVAHRHQLPGSAREQALVQRVDVLTRTRSGALDVQAAELRRIERDLHDGAQARLVALSMHLGRAEERVADQPEIAELLRHAREDAGAAISELRDLARGIAPPILADRGLTAAIEALARRSAIGVTIDADPDRRPLPVVETAAYFVVAEALTNVAKHAGGAAAHVRVTLDRAGTLVLEIADEGPGGANPGGSGLAGLRSRVEALDGALTVTSPPGGGTTIRAELPCAQ